MIREFRIINFVVHKPKLIKHIVNYSEFDLFDTVVMTSSFTTYFMTVGSKTYRIGIANYEDTLTEPLAETYLNHYVLALIPKKIVRFDMVKWNKFRELYEKRESGVTDRIFDQVSYDGFREYDFSFSEDNTELTLKMHNVEKLRFSANKRDIVTGLELTYVGTRSIKRVEITEPFVETVT